MKRFARKYHVMGEHSVWGMKDIVNEPKANYHKKKRDIKSQIENNSKNVRKSYYEGTITKPPKWRNSMVSDEHPV